MARVRCGCFRVGPGVSPHDAIATADPDPHPMNRTGQHLAHPDTDGAGEDPESEPSVAAVAQPGCRATGAGQVDANTAPVAAGPHPHQRVLPVRCSSGAAARDSRARVARLRSRHGQRRHSAGPLRGQAVPRPLPSSTCSASTRSTRSRCRAMTSARACDEGGGEGGVAVMRHRPARVEARQPAAIPAWLSGPQCDNVMMTKGLITSGDVRNVARGDLDRLKRLPDHPPRPARYSIPRSSRPTASR